MSALFCVTMAVFPFISDQVAFRSIPYSRVEAIFTRLLELVDGWKGWMLLMQSLESVDEQIDSEIPTARTYDSHFRSIRSRRRDLEKVAPTVKVHCVTVKLDRARRQATETLNQLERKLKSSLLRSSQTLLEQLLRIVAASNLPQTQLPAQVFLTLLFRLPMR